MSENRHSGAPPGAVHRAWLDDVPAVLAALIEHRDHPDAPAAALKLLEALEDSLAACPRSEWREWAAVCEAAEETLRRIEDAQRRRLGLRRVAARGEAGAAPQDPEPMTVMAQGPRRRGGRCRRAWSPPDCDGRRWRSP